MKKSVFLKNNQSGAILWVVLVAVFIMMVMAVGFIKSTDTQSVIVNNITTQQSMITSADPIIEDVRAWLILKSNGGADSFGCVDLFQNCSAAGYTATQSQPASNQTWDAFFNANLSNFRAIPANALGYTGSVWVQRLCKNSGTLTGNECSTQRFGTSATNNSVGNDSVDVEQIAINYMVFIRMQNARGASVTINVILQGSS
jgi:Tfp pilus assembly protein PilX